MRRGRVLVADDNRDAAESLAWCCGSRATKCRIAFGGAEALEIGERERPRAAIIDIGMPGMSGHEVARRMRLEAWGRNAVLIALTGWGQEQDKQAAKAGGLRRAPDQARGSRRCRACARRNARECAGGTRRRRRGRLGAECPRPRPKQAEQRARYLLAEGLRLRHCAVNPRRCGWLHPAHRSASHPARARHRPGRRAW